MDYQFARGLDRLSPLRRSAFVTTRPSRSLTVRTFATEGSRRPWEFGRFLKTVLFFNDPLQNILKTFTKPAEEPAPTVVEERPSGITRAFGPMESASSPIVLFGQPLALHAADLVMEWRYTQGSGSDIGRCLLGDMAKKGMFVRAVVDDVEQAQAAFVEDHPITSRWRCIACATQGNLEHDPASILDLVQWNKAMSMPRAIASPRAIAACGALAPYVKCGRHHKTHVLSIDGGSRLLKGILQPSKDVYNPSEGIERMTWGSLDDVVMGGCSESALSVQQGKGDTADYAAVFSGNITSANNGGFASVRTKNLDPPLNLKEYDGMKLRIRGDGQRYKFMLRTTEDWDSISFCQSFDTKEGWQDVKLPFKDFFPVFRAKSVIPAPSLDLGHISSLQIMLSKFEYDGELNPSVRMGRFELPIESITTFVDDSKIPPVVLIGSSEEDQQTLKNMTEKYSIINVDAEQEEPLEGSTLVAFSMACLTAEEAMKMTFNEKKRSIPTEDLTFEALAENFSKE